MYEVYFGYLGFIYYDLIFFKDSKVEVEVRFVVGFRCLGCSFVVFIGKGGRFWVVEI